jgi:sulfur-carrier protein
MKVTFYATLREVVGAKSVEFNLPEDPTVQHLLDEMIRCYPGLQKELLNDQGELYPHVHLFVNGRDLIYLESEYQTTLSPKDKITVFPAVGGGRR